MLKQDDIHHILCAKRLKIKLIGAGIVRGDRLGIIIDNDRLIPGLLYGLHRMNGGIVKLDPLADPDGACAEHDDLAPV